MVTRTEIKDAEKVLSGRIDIPATPAPGVEGYLRDLLGQADIEINGSRPWDIQVFDDRFIKRVVMDGALGLGESYMDAWWDVKALDQLICRILKAELHKKLRPNIREVIRHFKAILVNMQSRKKAQRDVQSHYDMGNELYFSFLDPYRQYSCGYFAQTDDLNKAQEQKLELICRKLELKPKDKVLDIGCGWGGFARYAASNYGCNVTGVTISEEQANYAQEFCRGLPVLIKKLDYRDINQSFNKIVSVGMLEHVGYKNYQNFMEVVHRCLHPKGLFLLHTIGSNTPRRKIDTWMNTYIFPNATIPAASQIKKASEGLFVLEDWHNFGVYYANTLRAWMVNFDRSWKSLKSTYDERFYRMWKYYLLSCAGAFDARFNQVWQIVFSPRGVEGGYSSVR